MPINNIGWCSDTWNPVIGCEDDCEGCYMHLMGLRFKDNFGDTHKPHLSKIGFNRKLHKESQGYFVNSCSELGYWKEEWLDKMIQIVIDNPHHVFYFLTKQPTSDQVLYLISSLVVSNKCTNVMFGVTVRNQEDYDRYCNDVEFNYWLIDSPYRLNTFISYEPMLGELKLSKFVPDWIILGAMTGAKANKYVPERSWIESICKQMTQNDRSADIFMKDSIKELAGDLFIQRLIFRQATALELKHRPNWGQFGTPIPHSLQVMIDEHHSQPEESVENG